ncbi:efflux RND transporter periplasmic adaptor subunit [Phenylobacterium montanum]|uniref:efflux RND transporter periplasmic adaptor subunit n=1 Tax=Phenylobacterium montanum TaxID=2823693 RepID=UPI002010F81E|nr:efflux RND transporter periplasmic adaptor subunit [Caulobacter sp. S6]
MGVVTLKTEAVTLTSELPGRTAPYEISDVRPQVGGIVIDRPFTEGAEVKAGQVLYRIDPAPFRAAYDQAKAQLASAEANLTTTRLKAERYADLVKINGVGKQDYDDAEAAFRQAAAAVEQQRAAAETAKINLAWSTIRAPITGRIGPSAITEGALVTPGQATALATIQRLDPIYVDVTQSAAEVLKLRRAVAAGQRDAKSAASVAVRLKLEDGSDYPLEGRLQFTDVTVDQATGAVTLRALFPNPGGLLLPGMYVRAEVAQGTAPQALLAPQQGISRDEKGLPIAMVVDAQGRAQQRSVQTDGAVGNQWLILGGLKAGDRLIVEGLQKVKPGEPVHVAQANLALTR